MNKFQILKEYEKNHVNVQDLISNGITNNIEIDKVCFNIFGGKYLGTKSAKKNAQIYKRKTMFYLKY